MRVLTHYPIIKKLALTSFEPSLSVSERAADIALGRLHEDSPSPTKGPLIPTNKFVLDQCMNKFMIKRARKSRIRKVVDCENGLDAVHFHDDSFLILLPSAENEVSFVVPWAFVLHESSKAPLMKELQAVCNAFSQAEPLATGPTEIGQCLEGRKAYPYFARLQIRPNHEKKIQHLLEQVVFWLTYKMGPGSTAQAVLTSRNIACDGAISSISVIIRAYDSKGLMPFPLIKAIEDTLLDKLNASRPILPLSHQIMPKNSGRGTIGAAETSYDKASGTSHEHLQAIARMSKIFSGIEFPAKTDSA